MKNFVIIEKKKSKGNSKRSKCLKDCLPKAQKDCLGLESGNKRHECFSKAGSDCSKQCQ
jgi:hypothetical protein